MPKAISTPLEQQFKLEKWDPAGDSFVTIRQARQWQHEKREDLFAETSRVWREGDLGEVEMKQRVSFSEVMRTEVGLTLVDSNLVIQDVVRDASGSIVSESTRPAFRFSRGADGRQFLSMTTAEFAEAWGLLEPELCLEIHQKVFEVNPMWKRGEA
jgi:hypothetical protein